MTNIETAKQMAEEVQDACNLSGVVYTFGTALKILWEEAYKLNKGTKWVNEHPVTKRFVSKLMDLSRTYNV